MERNFSVKLKLSKSKLFFMLSLLCFAIYFFASLPYGFGNNTNAISGNWRDENILEEDEQKSNYNDSGGLIEIKETINGKEITTVLIFNEYQLGYWAYCIENKNDDFHEKNVKLMNNINLGAHFWMPVAGFEGNFNGQGYTISNMCISYNNGNIDAGFFSYIKNLTVENVNFLNCRIYEECVSAHSIGIIAGALENKGIIKNCRVIIDSSINISDFETTTTQKKDMLFGGIAGWVSDATIENCHVEDKRKNATTYNFVEYFSEKYVENKNQNLDACYIGGIVGIVANGGSITLCSSNANINGIHMVNEANVGGIVGLMGNGNTSVLKCCNYGDVVVGGPNSWLNQISVGGIVGQAKGTGEISNCFNKGSISTQLNPNIKLYKEHKEKDEVFNIQPNASYLWSGSYSYIQNSTVKSTTCSVKSSFKINGKKRFCNKGLCYVGGIVGLLNNANIVISNCYNYGTTTSNIAEEISDYLLPLTEVSVVAPTIPKNAFNKNPNDMLISTREWEFNYYIFKAKIDTVGPIYGRIKGGSVNFVNNYSKSEENNNHIKAVWSNNYSTANIGSYWGENNLYAWWVSANPFYANMGANPPYWVDLNKDVLCSVDLLVKGQNNYYIKSNIYVENGKLYFSDNIYSTSTNSSNTVIKLEKTECEELIDFEIQNYNSTIKVDNVSATSLETSVWAQDPKINSGDPYIKEMYWGGGVQEPLSLRYSYDETNKQATVIGFNGHGSVINIPEMVGEYDVVAIGNSAFKSNEEIKEVVLPNSITSIGNLAFFQCKNLKKINMSKSLKIIGDQAFDTCEKLESIVLPYGLKSIGYTAFASCYELREVVVPNSVETIGSRAFGWCNKLEKLTIPFVGYSRNATDTTSLFGYILADANPNNVSGLTRVVQKFNNGTSERNSYIPTNLKTIIITDSTEIKPYAFYNCNMITNVQLPNTLTTIGDFAFAGSGLSGSLNLNNDGAMNGLKTIGSYAFKGCTSITSGTINDGVTTIGEGAFEGCSSLARINWPKETKEIKANTFKDCTAFYNLVYWSKDKFEVNGKLTNWLPGFPCTIKTIGNYAFMNTGLKGSLNLNKGSYDKLLLKDLTTIGAYAFKGCIALTGGTIYDGVTSVGEGAFEGCSSLKQINWPKGTTIANNTLIANNTFKNCKNLEKIVYWYGKNGVDWKDGLPDTVTSIGDAAFSGCAKINGIYLEGLTKLEVIGDSTFSGCSQLGLTNLSLTAIKSIGQYAFQNCSQIMINSLPSTLQSLGKGAFKNCLLISSINIKSISITQIDEEVFEGCSKLKTLILTSNITKIKINALKGCTALNSIRFAGTKEDWNKLYNKNIGLLTGVTVKCNDGILTIS